ncbi:MAG: outer membrane protein [Candidatus Midichloria sp.]
MTKGTPETKGGARGALVGATMGYYFSDHLRWEVNFNYSLNNKFYGNNQGSSLTSLGMFKVKAYQFSIATSLLYDLKKDSEISPFIGGGVGYNHITTSAASPKSFLGKNNDLIFFKAVLGIDYNINPLVQLQLAYDINYNTKKPDLINFNEDLLNAVSDPKTQMIKLPKIFHTINVGLKLNF